MWSGKTNCLLSRVDEARRDYEKVVLIKANVDKRHPTHVVARTGLSLPADVVVSSLDDIEISIKPATLYAIDEGQFFGESLLRFYERLRRTNENGSTSRLIVAGLDLDFKREPFGSCLRLAMDALKGDEQVTIRRLAARCAHAGSDGVVCGKPALFTQRLSIGDHSHDRVLVGGADAYRPACLRHHQPRPVPGHHWATVDNG